MNGYCLQMVYVIPYFKKKLPSLRAAQGGSNSTAHSGWVNVRDTLYRNVASIFFLTLAIYTAILSIPFCNAVSFRSGILAPSTLKVVTSVMPINPRTALR